ncbi:MAG: DUF3786 domain-containing protein [Lachnospiraceae bacterium]|nr:DUF3786 domain-containing protein [Lachnospiraceae bacterium]
MIDKSQIKNNKEEVPWEHYLEQFRDIDPVAAAARCRIPYDEAAEEFTVVLLGVTYQVHFPDFTVRTEETGFAALRELMSAKILVIRYLIEGTYFPAGGKYLTFRESPWGEVYHVQFSGRCLSRLAFGFGYKLPVFAEAMRALGGERVSTGDEGYRFELMPGFTLQFILWGADDEFQPSAQILFSDNIPLSFSAEDLVVMAEIAITTLKKTTQRSGNKKQTEAGR